MVHADPGNTQLPGERGPRIRKRTVATRGAVLTGRYVLMFPFCAAAWSGPLRLANEANALSWIIGALLFDGIFKLPILVRVRQSSGRMLGRLLLISWLCSLWVACFDSQV